MTGASAVIIVLVITAAFVLNSGMVDLFAKKQLLSLFNQEYRGRLELKEVRLRFPDQVTIVKPGIFEEKATTPTVCADSVLLRFNFLSLLRPKITLLSFREVDVEGFRANIVEHPDGKFNIQNIFTRRHPEQPEVLAIGKFRARRLKIRNGSVSWKPKAAKAYHLQNLVLDMSRVFVAKYEFMGTIKNMRFTMPERGLTIKNGAGSLAFSSVRSDVIGLDLETERSRAKLSVSMDGLDIFSGLSREHFLKSKAFVHIESVSLDTADLSRFVTMSSLPDGVYRITGDAKGTLADLEIMPSAIELGDSRISFRGKMLNVLDRENLSFRLQIDKSAIAPEMLSGLSTDERFRQLARAAKGIGFNGILRGRLDKWMTDIDFRTAIGSGSAAFETTRSAEAAYRSEGTFTLENLEPHRLLDLGSVRSGFSGSGSFRTAIGKEGLEGAHLEASVKKAFWQQQTLSSGSLTLDLDGRKLDLSTDLRSPEGGSIVMAGIIDFSTPSSSYQLGGSVRKLDVSKASGRTDFRSDLNGTFELKGVGIDPASINVRANLLLAPSSINDFRFSDRSAATLSVVQSDGSSSITLTSEPFDLSLQGTASLARVLETLHAVSACISNETGHPGATTALYSQPPFAFSYRITVRDLTPLRPLLPSKELQFRGSAAGKASSAGGRLSVDSDIVCSTLSSGSLFSLGNASLKASIQCVANDISAASASGTASSLTIFGRESKNLSLSSSFENDQLTTSLELAMPQFDEKLTTRFHARRTGNVATVTIDHLQLANRQGTWQTPAGSTFDVATEFIRFNRFRFDKSNQSVELDGVLSSSMPGTFRCVCSNLDLAEAKSFLLDPALKLLSGRADARLTVSGNPGAKRSDFELKGSAVTYGELNIGKVNLTASHAGDQLHFSFDSRGSIPATGTAPAIPVNTIEGSGSVPLELSYSPIQVRIPENRPLQINFHSDDLSARIVSYIVPIFDYADGTIPTDLRIAGRMPKPEIFLTTRLDGTRIRIGPTQVTYRVNGQISGTPSRIDLGRLVVRDPRENTGTISGIVGLEGLKPVSINLSGSFRDLLLYDKKDLKDDTSFGTISGTSDNIRFYGDLTAPTAEGELQLTSTDFSLYRKGSNESAKYIGVEKFITFVPRKPSPKPLETPKTQPAGYPQFNYNLLDILQIRNLSLISRVPIRGTMIFDRIRGERIEASMNNLALLVNKSGQRFSLYGSVDITGGKYSFSNSGFDLDNGGKVVWNNEEIRNGRLNDIYGSKQVSAYDVQTGERDNVKLLIAVSGTIDAPNVRMGYYLNDDPQPYSAVSMIGRQPSHIDANADLNVISMLFSRQWYLNPQRQAGGGTNPVQGVGISAGTGLLSSQVSSIVQKIAGLESFNVNLGTGANGNLNGLELYFSMLVPGTDGKVRFIGTGSTPVSRTGTTTNYYYGSSQKIEYRVNPKVYVEAFRSYGQTGNDATSINLQKPVENWGASVSYREKFHSWSQFWDHLFGGKKKEKKE